MKIVPAILTDRLAELRGQLERASTFADYVQIDFMDGRFVPSRSVSPHELDGLHIPVGCEAHLMVQEPEAYLDALKTVGFDRAIFHLEVTSKPERVIQMIKERGMEAGMAINPETSLSRLEELASVPDSVLFLSVTPGFYGSRFIPSVLRKISRFRQNHPDMIIGIDGGVALGNITKIKAAGVSYACVGSRIFLSDDPAGSYREFEERADDR